MDLTPLQVFMLLAAAAIGCGALGIILRIVKQ